MIAIAGLLTIVILSITVVRIGGIALELTGLSPEVATFQAQSAFSGAGFTTAESESIVTHPNKEKDRTSIDSLRFCGYHVDNGDTYLVFSGRI